MRRRSQAQQIHHHQFAVVVPSAGQESNFRRPTVRQQRRIFGKPGPIHAAENQVGQLRNVGVLKVLAAGQNSAQQNSGVNRRNFGIPNPFSGIDVGEVVEKTAMMGNLFPQKTQGGKNALECCCLGNEAALLPDAESRQPETGSSDARYDSLVIVVNIAAILNHARLWAGLLPEKQEVCAFQIVQKLVIFWTQRECRELRGR